MLLGPIADITKHIIHNIVIFRHCSLLSFQFYHGQIKLLFFKREQKHYNLLSIFSFNKPSIKKCKGYYYFISSYLKTSNLF